MISWLYDRVITDTINFDRTFESNSILIVVSRNLSSALRKVGYLHVEVLIDGELFTAQRVKLELGNNLISIPFSSYRLSFKPIASLLTIYQNTSIKLAQFNINMQVTPASSSLPQVGEDIFTTVYPANPDENPPVFLIAAALPRKAARITNKTTAGMYLKGGKAANAPLLVAADPFTFVPPGGSYTFEDYSGDIVGIMDGFYADNGVVLVAQSPYQVSPTVVAPPSGA